MAGHGEPKSRRVNCLRCYFTDDAPGHDAVSLPRQPDSDILSVPVCLLATALKLPRLAWGYEKSKC